MGEENFDRTGKIKMVGTVLRPCPKHFGKTYVINFNDRHIATHPRNHASDTLEGVLMNRTSPESHLLIAHCGHFSGPDPESWFG